MNNIWIHIEMCDFFIADFVILANLSTIKDTVDIFWNFYKTHVRLLESIYLLLSI